MADDVKSVGADGVSKAQGILDQKRQRVVVDVRRARPRRIAALIGGYGAEAGGSQRAELVTPLVGCLREAMKEDHDFAVIRTGYPHIEREIANADLRKGQAGGGLPGRADRVRSCPSARAGRQIGITRRSAGSHEDRQDTNRYRRRQAPLVDSRQRPSSARAPASMLAIA